jgi:hypothetical protein
MRRAASPFLIVRASVVLLGGLLPLLAGCAGAGPYGHSARYVDAPGEAHAAEKARDYDPVMVQRMPDAWHGVPVSLFGVVVARAPGPGGAAYLTLSVRRLEPRNLCEFASDETSCRTTVSDHDFGIVHALVALAPEDDVGGHSLGAGSLVRVIGTLTQNSDPNDGNPVIHPTFYRHWPRYFFVTRGAAASMRQ